MRFQASPFVFRAVMTLLTAWLTIVAFVSGTTSVMAQLASPSRGFRSLTAKTPDGVLLAIQEWGNPSGPEILFIQAFSQTHLSWLYQVTSDLAETFHMITYDSRGQGDSDKPVDPSYYKENSRWADELRAVMVETRLKKPVLVGWSYGGRIILDYLMRYGDADVSGINFVAATVKAAPDLLGPAFQYVPKMASENLLDNIENTRAFLKRCTAKPLAAEDFEILLASNMVTLPKIRLNMMGRPTPYEEILKGLTVPVLVTHGTEDQATLVGMGRYTASTVPKAQLALYEGIGHMPFWEDPSRFNRELAEFVWTVPAR